MFNEGIEDFISGRGDLHGTFDLIILIHVLEHLYNPVEKLKALGEFLKPGGHLLLQVPTPFSADCPRVLRMFHIAHVNQFSETTLKRALHLGGFNSVRYCPSTPRVVTYLSEKTHSPAAATDTWPLKAADSENLIKTLREKIDREYRESMDPNRQSSKARKGSQSMRRKARDFYKGLQKETVPCNVCGSPDLELLLDRDRYNMNLTTALCGKCGFLFTQPRPTAAEMAKFYQRSYRQFYADGDPEKDHEKNSPVFRRAERLARWLSPQIQKTEQTDPAILDVGCGAGVLLHTLKRSFPGALLYGIEPDIEFASHAQNETRAEIQNKSLEALLGAGWKPARAMDFIVLNHCLEHLHDPVEKLAALSAWLKPSGQLLIEVPNSASPRWARPIEMFHLAHLNHFTPQTMSRAATRAGFVTLRYSELSPLPEPWAMTFLLRKRTAADTEIAPAPPVPPGYFLKLKEKILFQQRVENRAQKILGAAWYRLIKKVLVLYQDFGARHLLSRAVSRATDMVSYRFQEALAPLVASSRRRNHRENAKFLDTLIRGKKVLIIGSGPSAREINNIPEEALVFTCNRGLKLFGEGRLNRPIDLYLCTRSKIERLRIDERSNTGTRIRFFLTDDIAYAQQNKTLKNICERVLFDDGMDDHFLRQLLDPGSLASLRGRSTHPWTSTGIRLLQYALYYGASEIYLAGIEFGQHGYFWGRSSDPWHHEDIDKNFIRAAGARHACL